MCMVYKRMSSYPYTLSGWTNPSDGASESSELDFSSLPNEILTQQLMYMNFKSLQNICRAGSRYRAICNSEYFWKRKLRNDTSLQEPLVGMTYKQTYTHPAILSMIQAASEETDPHIKEIVRRSASALIRYLNSPFSSEGTKGAYGRYFFFPFEILQIDEGATSGDDIQVEGLANNQRLTDEDIRTIGDFFNQDNLHQGTLMVYSYVNTLVIGAFGEFEDIASGTWFMNEDDASFDYDYLSLLFTISGNRAVRIQWGRVNDIVY